MWMRCLVLLVWRVAASRELAKALSVPNVRSGGVTASQARRSAARSMWTPPARRPVNATAAAERRKRKWAEARGVGDAIRTAKTGSETIARWERARAPNASFESLRPAERRRVGRDGLRPYPVYLKFHKVGSATVARTIRCLSYAEPRLVPDAWRSPRTVTHAARPGGDARCGASAWEHDVVLLYRREGVAGVRACLAAGFAPRLVTVLRDPVERVLSAVYFFLGGDGPGGPERAEARFRKYGGRAPAPLEAADLEAIVNENNLWREGGLHEYLQGLAAGAARGPDGGPNGGREDGPDGSPDGGAAPRGYTPYRGWHAFSDAELARAKRALRDDFALVGVTEELDGFLVLLAQLFGWPMLSVCYVTYHKNFRRPPLAELPNDTRAALAAGLAQEVAVYDEARRLYREAVEAAGPAHARQLGALIKARDDGTCQSAKKAQQRRVGQLPDRVLPHGHKLNCV